MTKITSWKTLITWFNDVNNVFDDPNNVVDPAKNPVCFIQNANDKPQPNKIMAFDPNLPVEDSPLDAVEMRGQLNALKALIDDLQAQIAALVPVLTRSADGHWTLAYAGPPQGYWQIWVRSSANPAWSNSGDMQTNEFPAADADIVPDGVSWWQVKMCGEDGDDNPCTPFSNVISFGPVPE
jgi:hypothetical protein